MRTSEVLWQHLLMNTAQWWATETELLKIFKELHDAGAELEWKNTYNRSYKRNVPTIKLKRGKMPEEDWNMIRTLKLSPNLKKIKEIFEVTALGTVIDVQLAKPLPENCLYNVLCEYFDEIVAAKERGREFTIQFEDKEITIVPFRTSLNRTELTVEELFTLKYLQDMGVIKEGEAKEWVRWRE